MKVIFHSKYLEVYSSDPAASPGRLEVILDELKDDYEFVEPEPCSDDDVLLVHTAGLLEEVKAIQEVYEVAALAAGGAILAGNIAFNEPAFALIRPPGHHANPGYFWGFCYFNNIAIAVRKLIVEGRIHKAVIVDFDLHFGDGTDAIFKNDLSVEYFHMPVDDVGSVEDFLKVRDYDIVAVSAGFDKHKKDWGDYLETEDYRELGKIIAEFAAEKCHGRRFAVLEGGYNTDVLGKNVKAFLKGFEMDE
jgi:acetoin utilization deacetylase AcuC-like enzyme